MTNLGTQGVAHHFLKYHTDLNVRIRTLQVLPDVDKNPWTLWHYSTMMHRGHRIPNDKPTLFINSWLIRLWVDNVLLINTRSLSIVIDKPIPLSIGISTLPIPTILSQTHTQVTRFSQLNPRHSDCIFGETDDSSSCICQQSNMITHTLPIPKLLAHTRTQFPRFS